MKISCFMSAMTLFCVLCVLRAAVSGDKETTYFMCNPKTSFRNGRKIEIAISIFRPRLKVEIDTVFISIFDPATRSEERDFLQRSQFRSPKLIEAHRSAVALLISLIVDKISLEIRPRVCVI